MKKLILLSILAFTLSLSAQVPGYVPTSGLLGWWPFNGNADDESGNGNNGTANGAVLTNDRNGINSAAYNLPNLDDNISVTNAVSSYNGNSISISLWMNFPLQWNQSSIFMALNGTPWSDGFSISIDQNNAAYGVNNYQVLFLLGPTACTFIANQSELGTWANIIGVYDGANVNLYLNNVLKASVSNTSNITCLDGNLSFADWLNPTIPIVTNRNIDDIAIWNRALTDCEIQQLYNASFLSSSQSPSICNGSSVTVGLNTYDSTGVYTDTLTSVNGCDSIVTTNLTILQDASSSISPTICNGNSITVGGSTYDSTGVYSDTLTAANSCDSIVTTNLTVLDCSGIEDALLSQVNIYPNPATNQISLIIPQKLIGKSYQILDYSGRQIRTGLLTEINSMIDLSPIAKGVYILQIGEQKLSLKLVKE